MHTPLQSREDLKKKYEKKIETLGLKGKPEFAPEEQVFGKNERKVRNCVDGFRPQSFAHALAIGINGIRPVHRFPSKNLFNRAAHAASDKPS